MQRYEDAARVRDDAERLRHLVIRHRSVESLRRVGRLVLHVEGEGTVELDEGLLVESATLFDQVADPGVGHSGGLDPVSAVTADGHDNERLIVAQWLRANADKVRVLASDGRDGVCEPADRVPTLGELCGGVADPAGTDLGRARSSRGCRLAGLDLSWVSGVSRSGVLECRGLVRDPDELVEHGGGPAGVDLLRSQGDAGGQVAGPARRRPGRPQCSAGRCPDGATRRRPRRGGWRRR